MIDGLFLLGEGVGTQRVPFDLLARNGIVREDHAGRRTQNLFGDRRVELYVGIGYLMAAQESDHLRGVGFGQRKIGGHLLPLREPQRVGRQSVVGFDRQVANPVYIDSFGHFYAGRTQRIACRVDIDLAVEYRGGDTFGVKPDFVGLAPFHVRTVHQKVFVE